MIVHMWCVIDPKFDRPFFSSSPPTTLRRDPGIRVIRYQYEVPDPTPGDVEVRVVESVETARAYARVLFNSLTGK